MNVYYVNPGIEAMLPALREAFGQEGAFWTDGLYAFYPQLDRERMLSLPARARGEEAERVFRAVYAREQGTLEEKAARYQAHWDAHSRQINEALSDAFDCDSRPLFEDMTCRVTLNPICPRYLTEHAFDVFYRNSERGALGVSLHELIHFMWFHVWHRLFGDDYAAYERPSLPWILSEMVVETIMRDERLSTLNPYFPREAGGCIYAYFWNMTVDGTPVLDTIDGLYATRGIREFMQDSYAFCQTHEAEIRRQIEAAER